MTIEPLVFTSLIALINVFTLINWKQQMEITPCMCLFAFLHLSPKDPPTRSVSLKSKSLVKITFEKLENNNQICCWSTSLSCSSCNLLLLAASIIIISPCSNIIFLLKTASYIHSKNSIFFKEKKPPTDDVELLTFARRWFISHKCKTQKKITK